MHNVHHVPSQYNSGVLAQLNLGGSAPQPHSLITGVDGHHQQGQHSHSQSQSQQGAAVNGSSLNNKGTPGKVTTTLRQWRKNHHQQSALVSHSQVQSQQHSPQQSVPDLQPHLQPISMRTTSSSVVSSVGNPGACQLQQQHSPQMQLQGHGGTASVARVAPQMHYHPQHPHQQAQQQLNSTGGSNSTSYSHSLSHHTSQPSAYHHHQTPHHHGGIGGAPPVPVRYSEIVEAPGSAGLQMGGKGPSAKDHQVEMMLGHQWNSAPWSSQHHSSMGPMVASGNEHLGYPPHHHRGYGPPQGGPVPMGGAGRPSAPQPPSFSAETNTYLAKLHKINPRVAQSIINDSLLDQSRLGFNPHVTYAPPPPPMYSHPKPPNSYSVHGPYSSSNHLYTYPQKNHSQVQPQQQTAPVYKYPSHVGEQPTSPQKHPRPPMQYLEQTHHTGAPMSNGGAPSAQRCAIPQGSKQGYLEYSQHYQHRQSAALPSGRHYPSAGYYPPRHHISAMQANCHPYENLTYSQRRIMENSIAGDESGGKNGAIGTSQGNINLKTFLESWNDEDMGNEAAALKAVKGTELYVLDSTDISNEAIGQYLHIQQFDKLPENIRGYFPTPEESPKLAGNDDAVTEVISNQDCVVQAKSVIVGGKCEEPKDYSRKSVEETEVMLRIQEVLPVPKNRVPSSASSIIVVEKSGIVQPHQVPQEVLAAVVEDSVVVKPESVIVQTKEVNQEKVQVDKGIVIPTIQAENDLKVGNATVENVSVVETRIPPLIFDENVEKKPVEEIFTKKDELKTDTEVEETVKVPAVESDDEESDGTEEEPLEDTSDSSADEEDTKSGKEEIVSEVKEQHEEVEKQLQEEEKPTKENTEAIEMPVDSQAMEVSEEKAEELMESETKDDHKEIEEEMHVKETKNITEVTEEESLKMDSAHVEDADTEKKEAETVFVEDTDLEKNESDETNQEPNKKAVDEPLETNCAVSAVEKMDECLTETVAAETIETPPVEGLETKESITETVATETIETKPIPRLETKEKEMETQTTSIREDTMEVEVQTEDFLLQSTEATLETVTEAVAIETIEKPPVERLDTRDCGTETVAIETIEKPPVERLDTRECGTETVATETIETRPVPRLETKEKEVETQTTSIREDTMEVEVQTEDFPLQSTEATLETVPKEEPLLKTATPEESVDKVIETVAAPAVQESSSKLQIEKVQINNREVLKINQHNVMLQIGDDMCLEIDVNSDGEKIITVKTCQGSWQLSELSSSNTEHKSEELNTKNTVQDTVVPPECTDVLNIQDWVCEEEIGCAEVVVPVPADAEKIQENKIESSEIRISKNKKMMHRVQMNRQRYIGSLNLKANSKKRTMQQKMQMQKQKHRKQLHRLEKMKLEEKQKEIFKEKERQAEETQEKGNDEEQVEKKKNIRCEEEMEKQKKVKYEEQMEKQKNIRYEEEMEKQKKVKYEEQMEKQKNIRYEEEMEKQKKVKYEEQMEKQKKVVKEKEEERMEKQRKVILREESVEQQIEKQKCLDPKMPHLKKQVGILRDNVNEDEEMPPKLNAELDKVVKIMVEKVDRIMKFEKSSPTRINLEKQPFSPPIAASVSLKCTRNEEVLCPRSREEADKWNNNNNLNSVQNMEKSPNSGVPDELDSKLAELPSVYLLRLDEIIKLNAVDMMIGKKLEEIEQIELKSLHDRNMRYRKKPRNCFRKKSDSGETTSDLTTTDEETSEARLDRSSQSSDCGTRSNGETITKDCRATGGATVQTNEATTNKVQTDSIGTKGAEVAINKRRLSLEEYNYRKRLFDQSQLNQRNRNSQLPSGDQLSTLTNDLLDVKTISCRKTAPAGPQISETIPLTLPKVRTKEEIFRCSDNLRQLRETRDIVRRFLNKEGLSKAELLKVREIIKFKSLLTKKEDEAETKDSQGPQTASPAALRKPRKRRRFRNLYSDEDEAVGESPREPEAVKVPPPLFKEPPHFEEPPPQPPPVPPQLPPAEPTSIPPSKLICNGTSPSVRDPRLLYGKRSSGAAPPEPPTAQKRPNIIPTIIIKKNGSAYSSSVKP